MKAEVITWRFEQMGISYPTALVAIYAVYCETKMQQLGKKRKENDIYFLKVIPLPYRLLVYVLNTGIAFYNYMTGFDDYFMGALLLVSMNMVINISKIIIEPDKIVIGNTKIKPEDFQLVELKKMDEKNAKFTFAMMVRKKRIQKDLFIPTSMMAELSQAIKQVKPAKEKTSSKKK